MKCNYFNLHFVLTYTAYICDMFRSQQNIFWENAPIHR